MTMAGTLPGMSLRDLERRAWLKRHLEKARKSPAHGEAMTRYEAALDIGVREAYIARWENPERGSPTKGDLDKVVRWMEKRLGVKAPR